MSIMATPAVAATSDTQVSDNDNMDPHPDGEAIRTATMTTTAANSGSPEDEDDKLGSLTDLFEPLEQLCSFGDVTLVLDDGVRIIVSRSILASASKVFSTMFSSRFAEGKQSEVHLQGDCSKTMLFLCSLLHNKEVPMFGPWPSVDILDFAFLADKYDCTSALRLRSDSMLNTFREDTHDDSYYEQLDHIVTAAYVLDQPDHFRHYCKQMVLFSFVYEDQFKDTRTPDSLQTRLLSSLKDQHNLVRQQLGYSISALVEEFARVADATERGHLTYELMKVLRERSLLPLQVSRKLSLHDILQQVQLVDLPVITTETELEVDANARTFARPRSNSWRTPPAFPAPPVKLQVPNHRTVERMVADIKSLCVGACLDCLRPKDSTELCRVSHPYGGRYYLLEPNDDISSPPYLVNEDLRTLEEPPCWDSIW